MLHSTTDSFVDEANHKCTCTM